MAKSKKTFKVCAAYDTETTTYHDDAGEPHAFVCLYIVNDLRNIDLARYEADKSDDIRFMRDLDGVLAYFDDLVAWGLDSAVVPIVAAYNLMFDLKTLQAALAERYTLTVTAQNSTHVYVYDCYDNGRLVLRFWDTFFLEMNGLAAMGRTAGLPKATGDWDYMLVRGTETPLTAQELFYAGRDTQVIPAYLRYLLDANEWMTSSDFGVRIMTKTSIVRRMALAEVGRNRIKLKSGKSAQLQQLYASTCKWEEPQDYYTYALRKACFRGGFTFTAASAASRVMRDVISIDAVSMHHAFINGRYVPERFQPATAHQLDMVCAGIAGVPLGDVLANYARPFPVCVHAMIKFTNIRLRAGSAFEHWGIALLAESKFGSKFEEDEDDADERNKAADEAVKARGWCDSASGAVFAFGKLYSAKTATVCVTELELWAMAQVYEWDSMEAVAGEMTAKLRRPPDYVSLQSNMLFERKQDAKKINKTYHEGEPYSLDIPASIPQGIADQLRAGALSNAFFDSFYCISTKGPFNAIYGTTAMDPWRPDFQVDEFGDIHVDAEAAVSPETFEDKRPEVDRSYYNYGMRIVGGSRVHLVIVLMLIYEQLGDVVTVCGGDTDSVKLALGTASADEVIDALQPLHKAIGEALDLAQARVRKLYPDRASTLDGVGTFELEPATRDRVAYEYHWEAWNKARMSEVNGHVHITCAGLSRPDGKYHLEHVAEDALAAGYDFETVAANLLSYNVEISPALCFSLQRTTPATTDRVAADLVDYKGNEFNIDAPEAIALYPAWRELGDTMNLSNLFNVEYLQKTGRAVDTAPRQWYVDAATGNVVVTRAESVIMNIPKLWKKETDV